MTVRHPYARPQLAFLGAGIMGAPMAARLVRAGYVVHLWNRTTSKAEQVDGAVVARSPAEAARDASIVITMLMDADAVDTAMSGPDGALSQMQAEDIWVQMSTVGLDGAYRLGRQAESADVGFLDAPVLGTRAPAENGQLKILASGPDDLLDVCAPVFEVLGEVFGPLGAAGQGSRLKLVANAWVLALTDATAASVALARNLDVDPSLFLRVIDGTGVDSPYAQLKGRSMIDGKFPASFSTAGAAKDAGLVADACRSSNTDLGLIEAVRAHLERSVELGHGEQDMASVVVAHDLADA
jgi:3-hydroxyisobutyrate dehydrogenase